MLSYRHGFHAGNFADVHKHAVLTLLLEALRRKDTAFFCLDTHAASGIYDLESEFARKNAEHRAGIARIVGRSDAPESARAYLEAVAGLNRERGTTDLRFYPGSPWLIRHFLRPRDRLALTELHPGELPVLRELFAGDRRVAVHRRDAYEGLKALLPPAERRGLVLIDPAYERRDEFTRVAEGLSQAWARWPSGVFALWYPIGLRREVAAFHARVRAGGVQKVLVTELLVAPDSVPRRLNGSGLLLVNPPWQIDERVAELGAWLAEALGDAARHRLEWLVPPVD